MALFSKTKKTEKVEKTVKSSNTIKNASSVAIVEENKKAPESSYSARVVIRPHITEKSGVLSQTGKYTFIIVKDANKQTISKAIQTLYKVTPTHVSIINLPSRNVFVRGRRGVVSGFRKAIVTLKKGETINFV